MSSDLTRRLPVEILAYIFVTLKEGEGGRLYGFQSRWVHVSWVCKRWREIALNMPSLWTSVAIPGHAAISTATLTLLGRAGGCGLDLYIDCQKFKDGDIYRMFDAAKLSEKVVEVLRIRYPKRSFREVDDNLRKLRWHRLSSLEVLRRNASRSSCKWEFDPSDFPSLRSLTMTSALPIATGPLLHLRRLTLKDIHPRHGRNDDYLHEFLRCCPSVASLSLYDAFVDTLTVSYSSLSIPIVTAPHLHYLSIRGPLLHCANILTPMRLPALRLLFIDARTEGVPHGNVFHRIFPSNSGEVLPLLSQTNGVSLYFGASSPNDHVIKVGGTIAAALPDNEHYEWSVSIPHLLQDDHEDGGAYLGEQCRDFIDNLPSLLNCANMIRLDLHVAHGLPVTRDWTAWLDQFSRLQFFTLGCGALVMEVLRHLRNDRKHELLPRMTRLKLCLCKLDDGSMTAFSQPDFCEWLRHRMAGNLPLTELTIRTPTDRPSSEHFQLNLGSMIVSQVRSYETGIRNVWLLDKENCTACDASY